MKRRTKSKAASALCPNSHVDVSQNQLSNLCSTKTEVISTCAGLVDETVPTRTRQLRSKHVDKSTSGSPAVVINTSRRGRGSKESVSEDLVTTGPSDAPTVLNSQDLSSSTAKLEHETLHSTDAVANEVGCVTYAQRLPEKVIVDMNQSHQRKVNKRELKALLKQSKKKSVGLDEKVLAIVDELSNQLKAHCLIDLNPYPVKPISIAPFPSNPPIKPQSKGRGGAAGRKPGRRGRGCHRSGVTLSDDKSTYSTVLSASWVPLLLPNPAVSKTLPSTGNSVSDRSFVPWLHQLSEARACRFVMCMRRLFGPTDNSSPTVNNCLTPNQPSSDADKLNSRDSSIEYQSQMPSLVHSTNTCSSIDKDDSLQETADRKNLTNTTPNESTISSSQPSTNTYTTRRRGRFKKRRTISHPKNVSILNNTVPSYSGQPPQHSLTDVGEIDNHSAYNPATPTTTLTTTTGRFTKETTSLSSKSKNKISRELRGLVTWDAVKAEQQKHQHQDHEQSDKNVASMPPVLHHADAALSVVTDLLATVEEEGEANSGTHPRPRRTRQSSGSVCIHNPQSVVSSESSSIQTTMASFERRSCDPVYQSKANDSSATAYCNNSTEASSISSDYTVKSSRFNALSTKLATKICSTVQKLSDSDQLEDDVKEYRNEHHQHKKQKQQNITNLLVNNHIDPMDTSVYLGSTDVLSKYSPISTEQDSYESNHQKYPNLSQSTVLLKDLNDVSVESPEQQISKRSKRKNNKGNKSSALQKQILSNEKSLNTETKPSIHTDNVQNITSAVQLEHQQKTPTYKRRRHLNSFEMNEQVVMSEANPLTIVSSSASTASQVSIIASSPSCSPSYNDDQVTAVNPKCALPTATSVIGLKRSSASRGSVLPPRKRYKAGLDPSATISSPSTQVKLWENDSQSGMADPQTVSSGFVNDVNGKYQTQILSSSPDDVMAEQAQYKKRGRGRPRRNKLTTSCESESGFNDNKATSGTSLSDRPKREAAALGFASLVSANLNKCSTPPRAVTTPTLDIQNESVEADLHQQQPSSLASAVEQSSITSPTTPLIRGRGRPPKQKLHPSKSDKSYTESKREIIDIPDVSAKASVKEDISEKQTGRLSSDADVKVTMLDSDNSNLDRTTSGAHTFIDNTTTPTTTTTIATTSATTTITTDIAINTFIETRTKSTKCQPASFRPLRDVGSSKTAPHNTSDRSSGRLKNNKRPLSQSTKSDTTDTLPSCVSLFPGSLISNLEKDVLSTSSKSIGNHLYDLFFRKFLSLPDPLEPEYCLCAPILYLPSPEKYPEFYRFILSSYQSGSPMHIRFTKSFLNRLFPASQQQQQWSSISSSLFSAVDEKIFHVEFPSLCLASIASRFHYSTCTDHSCEVDADKLVAVTGTHELCDFANSLQLPECDYHLLPIDYTNTLRGIQALDMAVDGVLTIWEAYAGRRSWLGRRMAQLKSAYLELRTEYLTKVATTDYDQAIYAYKSINTVFNATSKSQNWNNKKRSDRRALERGAEVIRCLCGFRVEGGHVMVQCDRCAAWQHLPCLWWALNLAIKESNKNNTETGAAALDSVARSNFAAICKGVLVAAQTVCSSSEPDSKAADENDGKDRDAPYFCPYCFNIDNLTKDYPRALSTAMLNMVDMDAVASLQETTIKGQYDYWSLTSSAITGRHQIRTDDYAFVSRFWMNYSFSNRVSTTNMLTKSATQLEELISQSIQSTTNSLHDYVIMRIYRLWKDNTGRSWFEGGLFLRPYDMCHHTFDSMGKSPHNLSWHSHEVVYDEASRLVLPIEAWSGRCTVLCPSVYRTGYPADLVNSAQLPTILNNLSENRDSVVCAAGTSNVNTYNTLGQQHVCFVCDKLIQQLPSVTEDKQPIYQFDEISPGYLKVNMKPYCFLRKFTGAQLNNRLPLARQCSVEQLLEYDKATFFQVCATQSDRGNRTELKVTNSKGDSASVVAKPKGEKLAKVVDWLERKLQNQASTTLVTTISLAATTITVANQSHSSTKSNQVLSHPIGSPVPSNQHFANERSSPQESLRRQTRRRGRPFKPDSPSDDVESVQSPVNNKADEIDTPRFPVETDILLSESVVVTSADDLPVDTVSITSQLQNQPLTFDQHTSVDFSNGNVKVSCHQSSTESKLANNSQVSSDTNNCSRKRKRFITHKRVIVERTLKPVTTSTTTTTTNVQQVNEHSIHPAILSNEQTFVAESNLSWPDVELETETLMHLSPNCDSEAISVGCVTECTTKPDQCCITLSQIIPSAPSITIRLPELEDYTIDDVRESSKPASDPGSKCILNANAHQKPSKADNLGESGTVYLNNDFDEVELSSSATKIVNNSTSDSLGYGIDVLTQLSTKKLIIHGDSHSDSLFSLNTGEVCIKESDTLTKNDSLDVKVDQVNAEVHTTTKCPLPPPPQSSFAVETLVSYNPDEAYEKRMRIHTDYSECYPHASIDFHQDLSTKPGKFKNDIETHANDAAVVNCSVDCHRQLLDEQIQSATNSTSGLPQENSLQLVVATIARETSLSATPTSNAKQQRKKTRNRSGENKHIQYGHHRTTLYARLRKRLFNMKYYSQLLLSSSLSSRNRTRSKVKACSMKLSAKPKASSSFGSRSGVASVVPYLISSSSSSPTSPDNVHIV